MTPPDVADLTRAVREYLAALGAVTPIPWTDAAPDGGENNEEAGP